MIRADRNGIARGPEDRAKTRGPPVRVAFTCVVSAARANGEPKRAVWSIKNVRGIIGQTVEIKEPEIFAGICSFAMMGLLVPDVVPESLVIEPRNAERTISMLPLEIF